MLTPKQQRAAALDYSQGVSCARTIPLNESERIEIADHWLQGYRTAKADFHRILVESKERVVALRKEMTHGRQA